jgi:recombinational DNA repair protein (RecF pathway)
MNKIEKFNHDAFVFYGEMLKIIVDNKYTEKTQMLIILRNLCPLLGIDLNVNECVRCGSHKLSTISFKDHGMICNLCFNSTTDTKHDLIISKIFHHLFNNDYSFADQHFGELEYTINMLMLYIKENSGIVLDTRV